MVYYVKYSVKFYVKKSRALLNKMCEIVCEIAFEKACEKDNIRHTFTWFSCTPHMFFTDMLIFHMHVK